MYQRVNSASCTKQFIPSIFLIRFALQIFFLLNFGIQLSHADDIEDGRTIAKVICAECHSIERIGESPHKQASPFRDLTTKYSLSALQDVLMNGISVDHPEMPEFRFEAKEVNYLIKYIMWLNRSAN